MNLENIRQAQQALYQHPMINDSYITNIRELRVFMEHHVFAVWDFMSLIKSIQHEVCPSTNMWIPTPYVQDGTARLINDIILAEESDKTPDGRSMSHFDMYLEAMHEVGADTLPIRTFLNDVITNGIKNAVDTLAKSNLTAAKFVRFTFEVIELDNVAFTTSCFTFGRETSIPDMFQGIVNKIGIDRDECPMFIYYLERHIELDGDDHGPKAIELVNKFSQYDEEVMQLSENVAINSISARIDFWDGVLDAIEKSRPAAKTTVAKKSTEQVREETAGILYPSNAVRKYGPRF